MFRYTQRRLFALLSALVLLGAQTCQAQVERVWLSHRSPDPSKIVVSWTTATPSESVVRYGLSKKYDGEVRLEGTRTLHHVEIPLSERGAVYHYSVGPKEIASADATFKSLPTDELRIAVVANWHSKTDLSALLADDVHLLLTGGDNVSSIWQSCGEGNVDCVKPYEQLVDAYPALFRSTPFMPVLGNHDREIRPRGPRPPVEPVYDVDATAFRKFFELPGDEWKWRFDIPEFNLRLIALDFNHTSDFGTTWQTCHPFQKDSKQFRWYEQQFDAKPKFVVTVYNERNATMRGVDKGAWHQLFRQGTACITGFGHFNERAEVDDLLYFNTSLAGKGTKYPDPKSQVLFSENGYVLMTLSREKPSLTIELKSLDGKVLDRTQVKGD